MANGVHGFWEELFMFLVGDDGVPRYLGQDWNGTWRGYSVPNGYDASVQLGSIATVELAGNVGTPMAIGLGAADASPYLMKGEYGCVPYGPCYQQWWWRGSLMNRLLPFYGPPPPGIRFKTMVAAQGHSGRPQVIGLGETDGLPYLMFENIPAWYPQFNSDWYWYGRLPGPAISYSTIATHRDPQGSLQVIGIGTNDGFPYLTYQVESSGNWYHWGPLPNPNSVRFRALAMGFGQVKTYQAGQFVVYRNLYVILLGAADGLPYLIWQDGRNQSWQWYGRLPTQ
jgi:hypothetical protein